MIRIFPLAAAARLISQAAVAHAFVQHASPAANSDLPAAPAAVTITFTEGVEPNFSSIEVRDPHDLRVENSHLHQVGRTGRQLSVGLPKLSVGKYTVIWSATSTDTHRIEGRFDFQVSP
jgi:methionine-rich copper-binding protein CopC